MTWKEQIVLNPVTNNHYSAFSSVAGCVSLCAVGTACVRFSCRTDHPRFSVTSAGVVTDTDNDAICFVKEISVVSDLSEGFILKFLIRMTGS